VEDFESEHHRLYAAATLDQLAREAFVKEHRLVDATHRPSGIRSRFRAVEHMNVGPGWMMVDVTGKVPGVVPDMLLDDLAPVPSLDNQTFQ
jgi:hypothetical protein